MPNTPLKIGLSARIFHPEQGVSGIKSKTLQVLEQSVAHWVMSRDVMVFMIPSILADGILERSNIRLRNYVNFLDGLVLQGGADVSPECYGQQPLRPEWRGDPVRDAYELELVHAFVSAGKPVLGICRGMQLINVAYGGTLYQDIPSQYPGNLPHEAGSYDEYGHSVSFPEGGWLRQCLSVPEGLVNSIHHQAVCDIGEGMRVEATSGDGVVEAIRLDGNPFVVGVQWHPEFHSVRAHCNFLDCQPLLDAYLSAARERRQGF